MNTRWKKNPQVESLLFRLHYITFDYELLDWKINKKSSPRRSIFIYKHRVLCSLYYANDVQYHICLRSPMKRGSIKITTRYVSRERHYTYKLLLPKSTLDTYTDYKTLILQNDIFDRQQSSVFNLNEILLVWVFQHGFKSAVPKLCSANAWDSTRAVEGLGKHVRINRVQTLLLITLLRVYTILLSRHRMKIIIMGFFCVYTLKQTL